jgi:hypothetical protein
MGGTFDLSEFHTVILTNDVLKVEIYTKKESLRRKRTALIIVRYIASDCRGETAF